MGAQDAWNFLFFFGTSAGLPLQWFHGWPLLCVQLRAHLGLASFAQVAVPILRHVVWPITAQLLPLGMSVRRWCIRLQAATTNGNWSDRGAFGRTGPLYRPSAEYLRQLNLGSPCQQRAWACTVCTRCRWHRPKTL